MEGDVDAVVLGVGSSGTVSGFSKYLKANSPQTEIIIADPVGSIVADYVNTGKFGESASWLVEGIGEDFIPEIADFSAATKGYSISDAESFETARELLRKTRDSLRVNSMVTCVTWSAGRTENALRLRLGQLTY